MLYFCVSLVDVVVVGLSQLKSGPSDVVLGKLGLEEKEKAQEQLECHSELGLVRNRAPSSRHTQEELQHKFHGGQWTRDSVPQSTQQWGHISSTGDPPILQSSGGEFAMLQACISPPPTLDVPLESDAKTQFSHGYGGELFGASMPVSLGDGGGLSGVAGNVPVAHKMSAFAKKSPTYVPTSPTVTQLSGAAPALSSTLSRAHLKKERNVLRGKVAGSSPATALYRNITEAGRKPHGSARQAGGPLSQGIAPLAVLGAATPRLVTARGPPPLTGGAPPPPPGGPPPPLPGVPPSLGSPPPKGAPPVPLYVPVSLKSAMKDKAQSGQLRCLNFTTSSGVPEGNLKMKEVQAHVHCCYSCI